MAESDIHYFYVVECNDGSFYAGYTNCLKKRIKTHNLRKGAKFTRVRLPVKLIYFEVFQSKSEALQAEYRFKRLKRNQKIEYMKKGFY